MKFAYADPPYLGCSSFYKKLHPEAMIWDDPETHRAFIDRLYDEYPDGWALSLHVPSLHTMLGFLRPGHRICAWVKPFASFKPNVMRAWTWEPVILVGGRPIPKKTKTWRDHIACNIALKKGLVGAKPRAVCDWILDGLNFQPGDTLDDLFPGTGIMGEAVAARASVLTPDEGDIFG